MTEPAIDAGKVTGPVLWLHGEEDQLVPMAGSRRGIALLRNANVTEKIYPGARHEIFNELNKDEVLADTTAFPRQGHRRLIGLCQVGIQRDRGRR